jgi:hypothetical protein
MIALRVGQQYEEERSRYEEVLKRHERRIGKTVDLFSRIKNTEQAEEVLTVLFASRELKRTQPQKEVAERDLYEFILNWKKAWRTDEKQQAVASAIRNLVMLGWMRLQFSESLSAATDVQMVDDFPAGRPECRVPQKRRLAPQ